jgi:putative membrane protein
LLLQRRVEGASVPSPAARFVFCPRDPVRLLFRLLINACALWAATQFVSGITFTGRPASLLGVALVFGIVNTFIAPVIKLFALPVIFLTLGIFLLVINALMLMLTSWLSTRLGLGFAVHGFVAAFIGSIVVTVVSFVLHLFVPDRKKI